MRMFSGILLLAVAAGPVEGQVGGKPVVGIGPAVISAADALALAKAYRAALAQPAVRTASDAAIRQQLKRNRPVAIVNRSWAVPVDLSGVYLLPAVQAGLTAQLAGNPLAGRLGAALANRSATNTAALVGIAFVGFGSVTALGATAIQETERNLLGSLAGLQAALGSATDDFSASKVVVAVGSTMLGLGPVGLSELGVLWNWATSGGGSTATSQGGSGGVQIDDPNADPDHDGVPNRLDGDDDGDGVPDGQDAHPYDQSTSICDCTGTSFFKGLLGTGSIGLTQVILSAHAFAAQASVAGRLTGSGALSALVNVQMAFPASVF